MLLLIFDLLMFTYCAQKVLLLTSIASFSSKLKHLLFFHLFLGIVKADFCYGMSIGKFSPLSIVVFTGQDIKIIEEALDRDRYMSPEEAKQFGIIDQVETSAFDL